MIKKMPFVPRVRRERDQDLMPYRVREVLLVSSAYDAFVLEEDGELTEQVFAEYKTLSLSSSPRFMHVTKPQAAFVALQNRQVDLVLVVVRRITQNLLEFPKQIKTLRPNLPVVLLGFESGELSKIKSLVGEDTIDAVFVWNGDAKILLVIVKYIEDKLNLEHDIKVADVGVILVVEDSIRYYSLFFTVLFPELMKQSQSLFIEGVNRLQKFLKMRSRPKIIHTITYEQSLEMYDKYSKNVLALITDVSFCRCGKQDPVAGLDLVRYVRKDNSDLPILIQSAEEKYSVQAAEFSAEFINKNSSTLLHTIQEFLFLGIGFGPFSFRLPDGTEIMRAHDVRKFAECIKVVPAESLKFHAKHNHISNWLITRSETELAKTLRLYEIEDLASIEDMREYFIKSLEDFFRQVHQGVIADFSKDNFDTLSLCQRMGDGSLGGKARGIAFLNHLVTSQYRSGKVDGLRVEIPQSFVLDTNAFDSFMKENNLYKIRWDELSDVEILRVCNDARLPARVVSNMKAIVEHVQGPLIARSSSLLEDNMMHPFAGIYGTIMIPNSADHVNVRLRDLCKAVKSVYASTFFANARSYISNTNHSLEEEKMAVVIQRLVGRQYAERFYPHFAGVADSYNYYPIGPMKATDGVVQVALGFGRLVLDAGEVVRFCPKYPHILPDVSANTAMVIENSQRFFYALDLTRKWSEEGKADFDVNQVPYDLPIACCDGTFACVGSVVDVQNDIITESMQVKGPLIVTFNNILKYKSLPFCAAMQKLLQSISKGMGTHVQIEFACDMGDLGPRQRHVGSSNDPPVLYLLQVRSILIHPELQVLDKVKFDPEWLICRSRRALGHGQYAGINDVVYVKPESFNPANSRNIARQVGQVNKQLEGENTPYILIGPGRWGSADHWLGIPVMWSQISNTKIIIEASPKGYNVEPSQGSHFFHNIIAASVGYFTVFPPKQSQYQRSGDFVDWDWLEQQPVVSETDYIRHVRCGVSLAAKVDGSNGSGVIAWYQK